MKIAVLITVYNRKEKTLKCLDSLNNTYLRHPGIELAVYLTDDCCTDGTADAVTNRGYGFELHVLRGNGNLYWNGGMINSWQTALKAEEQYDGYLWLNDDTWLQSVFWDDLLLADSFSVMKYGRRGIYVGSTCDPDTGKFTYGGFCFVNKWTLKDRFLEPDGEHFQPCQCAHGNITYVSKEVVDACGIFCEDYIHGGADHDYTYLAYKSGFPVLVLPHYAGTCVNDHKKDGYGEFFKMPLKERIKYLNSPFGFNLHNTLLFQKRCFPYRAPFVRCMGYLKALFPRFYMEVYRIIRK